MKKILNIAEENYSASFPEEDSIATSESSNEPNLVPYSSEADEVAFDKEQEGISEALGSVKTLDGVVDALESPEGGASLNEHAGKALMIAVEALCRIKLASEKPVLPTFEEFSTNKQRKLTAELALEGIKEWAIRVWDLIVNAISKAVDWFKKVFNFQKIKNDSLNEKAEIIEKEIKSASGVKASEVTKEDKVTYQRDFWAISMGGKVPDAVILLKKMQEHFTIINQFEHNFEKTEKTVIAKLSAAIKAIHIEGSAYNEYLDDARSAILSNNLGGRANNQNALGVLDDGFELYESKMVFGSKSMYRTGINKVLTANYDIISKNVKFGLITTSGIEDEYNTSSLDPLPEFACVDIARVVQTRTDTVKRTIANRDMNEIQLNELKKNIVRIQQNKNYPERSTRRAHSFLHALTIYLNYRKTMTISVTRYDQNVTSALLIYADKSKEFYIHREEQNA